MTNPFPRTKHHVTSTTPRLAKAAEATRLRRRNLANLPPSIEGLSLLLTDDQIRWLVRYLVDGVPCRVLADEWEVPRRTMAYRIRQAIRRLNEAGISVATPGRGRPRTKNRTKDRRPYVSVDPAALDRLTTTGRAGSVFMGKWIKSKETKEHEE